MRNTRSKLLAPAALAIPLALAAAPLAYAQCMPRAAATAQASDPALAMIREMQAELNAPFGGNLERFIAAQEAEMNRLFQQIDAMTAQAMRNPGTIEVAIPGNSNGAVSQIFVSSVSNGQGTCSETVTYSYGPDGKPRVAVQKTGSACGNVTFSGGAPAVSAPHPASGGARMLQVRGPAAPVRGFLRG
jgi:hypothetical protein